ncbi:hypothetical protein D047_1364A, partial [Vibrio parahaemolyticus VPTS-2010_2]
MFNYLCFHPDHLFP